jgi:hypothetical protein
VYLASHDVPRHELLEPTWHDVRLSYENEFAGMLIEATSYGDLIVARKVPSVSHARGSNVGLQECCRYGEPLTFKKPTQYL